MTAPKVKLAIVSGYEPFAPNPINPSQRIAKRLDGKVIGEGIRVVGISLPNDLRAHYLLMDEVSKARRHYDISKEEPVVIVSGGLSTSLHKLSIESVGWNEIYNKDFAWSNGEIVADRRPIEPGAPYRYLTNVRMAEVQLSLTDSGVPVTQSVDPGRYSCNLLAYGMLHLLHNGGERALHLFYHTGFTEEDKNVVDLSSTKKIHHPTAWLEKGVPMMVLELAKQAEAMASIGEWILPTPLHVRAESMGSHKDKI